MAVRSQADLQEVGGEGGADELVAGAAGHAAHGLVDVGDPHGFIHGDQTVHAGFDETTVIGPLLSQLLLEAGLLGDVPGAGEDAPRQRDQLSPLDAVIAAAKIRLRPRAMISFAIIFGLIPLALNLEEGGEMLQPMAAGAIGGLTLGILVALFMMPCLYVIFAGRKQGRSSSSTLSKANHRAT